MRILMPVLENKGEESEISEHFGHAPFFAIYDTESEKLEVTENSLVHTDKKITPVDQLMKHGPDVIYVIEIGQRAIALFREKGVMVKTGNFRTVKQVVSNLDNLMDVTGGCKH